MNNFLTFCNSQVAMQKFWNSLDRLTSLNLSAKLPPLDSLTRDMAVLRRSAETSQGFPLKEMIQ